MGYYIFDPLNHFSIIDLLYLFCFCQVWFIAICQQHPIYFIFVKFIFVFVSFRFWYIYIYMISPTPLRIAFLPQQGFLKSDELLPYPMYSFTSGKEGG